LPIHVPDVAPNARRNPRKAIGLFVAGLVAVLLMWAGEAVLRTAYVRAIDCQFALNERVDSLDAIHVALEQLKHDDTRAAGATALRAGLIRLMDPALSSAQLWQLPQLLQQRVSRFASEATSVPLWDAGANSQAHIEQLASALVRLKADHVQHRAAVMAHSRMWSNRMLWLGVAAFVLAAIFLTASAAMTLREFRRRRKSESAVGETLASIARVLEALPVAVHARDFSGRHLLWNWCAEAMYGRSRRDAIGSTMSVVAADSIPVAQAMRERAHQGEIVGPEPLKVVRSDGAVLDVRTMLAPYFNVRGEIIGTVGITYDVSSELQRESQRRQHDAQQRDMIVREVHHRIKNHLQGLAALVQQRLAPNGEADARVDEVVAQMLSLASVHGMQAAPGQELTLAASVRAIATNISALTGAECPVAGPLIGARWCVAERHAVAVALAVNELMTNAVKHRLAGSASPVEVTVEERTDCVLVRIRNRGVLPEDVEPKVLMYSGTGLSLVAALLPAKGASLSISQRDGWVIAELALVSPVVAVRTQFNTKLQGVAA
jgi:PAS domain S-box-containing protein